MISLVLPCYGDGASLLRTIESVQGVCDEVVVVTEAFFPDELEYIEWLADKVVKLPFGFVARYGDGVRLQMGAYYAKNPWCLSLGVADTMDSGHENVIKTIHDQPDSRNIYLADHATEVHEWTKIWNPSSGTRWDGLIHGEIGYGNLSGVLFRIVDTDKTVFEDPLKHDAFVYYKSVGFSYLYRRLVWDATLLGTAHPGWLEFANENDDRMEAYLEEHSELLTAMLLGKGDAFLEHVRERLESGIRAEKLPTSTGISFKKTGDRSEEQYSGHPGFKND